MEQPSLGNFEQPRLHTGAIDPNWGAADVTKRRYINQEDLTPVQLINLNARVYDPLLGKFMSPDPVISDQDDSQSWNAYAYSQNNPMSREDPTGLAGADDECNAGCMFWESVATGGSVGKLSGGAQGNSGLFLHTPAGDTQITAQNAVDLSARGVYSTPDAASNQLDYIDSIAHGLSVSTQMQLADNAALYSRLHYSRGVATFADVTVKLFPNAVGGFGHEGIGINTDDTVGFYPRLTGDPITKLKEGMDISVPGQVYFDRSQEPGQISESISIKTTAEQDRAMLAFVAQRIRDPGFYNLFSRNCSEFVRDVLKAGNVSAPSRISPTSQFGAEREFYPTLPVTTRHPQ
jgi:RHS repeat-associated protein